MTHSSTDPFVKIRGYRSQPKTISEQKEPGLPRPFVQQTIRVENYTSYHIATYGTFGLRTYIPPFNARLRNFVRVELTISIHQSAGIDYLAFNGLLRDLSEQQIQTLQEFFEAQDLNTCNSLRQTRLLCLHWDVPVDQIAHSPCGVLIESLGIVLQIHDPKQCSSEHYSVWHRPQPIADSTDGGIKAVFNKHDSVVKGVWVNLGGPKPIKICDNQNDTSSPEGLVVVMNGETLELELSEMTHHGFYLTGATAAAAHANTNAEQAAAHKQFIAEQDKLLDREEKQLDREDKRQDKERDFAWRETEREDKRENVMYERTFKEDVVHQDRRNKEHDRHQQIIDKEPQRKIAKLNAMFAPLTIPLVAIVTAAKLYVELKKIYESTREQ